MSSCRVNLGLFVMAETKRWWDDCGGSGDSDLFTSKLRQFLPSVSTCQLLLQTLNASKPRKMEFTEKDS